MVDFSFKHAEWSRVTVNILHTSNTTPQSAGNVSVSGLQLVFGALLVWEDGWKSEEERKLSRHKKESITRKKKNQNVSGNPVAHRVTSWWKHRVRTNHKELHRVAGERRKQSREDKSGLLLSSRVNWVKISNILTLCLFQRTILEILSNLTHWRERETVQLVEANTPDAFFNDRELLYFLLCWNAE